MKQAEYCNISLCSECFLQIKKSVAGKNACDICGQPLHGKFILFTQPIIADPSGNGIIDIIKACEDCKNAIQSTIAKYKKGEKNAMSRKLVLSMSKREREKSQNNI